MNTVVGSTGTRCCFRPPGDCIRPAVGALRSSNASHWKLIDASDFNCKFSCREPKKSNCREEPEALHMQPAGGVVGGGGGSLWLPTSILYDVKYMTQKAISKVQVLCSLTIFNKKMEKKKKNALCSSPPHFSFAVEIGMHIMLSLRFCAR